MNFLHRKNLPLFLMTSSILLLTVFQVFWLRGIYRDQFELLQRETDNLFLKSVRTLEDSMLNRIVIKGVEAGISDTIMLNHRAGRQDSVSLHILTGTTLSEHTSFTFQEHAIRNGQKPAADSLSIKISKQFGRPGSAKMIALWIADTLAPAKIQQRFNQALRSEDIFLDFDILSLASQEEHASTGGIVTSTVFSGGDEKLLRRPLSRVRLVSLATDAAGNCVFSAAVVTDLLFLLPGLFQLAATAPAHRNQKRLCQQYHS